jgi:hypothetical protein
MSESQVQADPEFVVKPEHIADFTGNFDTRKGWKAAYQAREREANALALHVSQLGQKLSALRTSHAALSAEGGDAVNTREIMFFVNQYDRDGDVTDKGVFLCVGPVSVKVADDLEGFRDFVRSLGSHLDSMLEEIEQNYAGEFES